MQVYFFREATIRLYREVLKNLFRNIEGDPRGGTMVRVPLDLSGGAACDNNVQEQIILTNRNNPLGIQLARICHFTPRVRGGGGRGVRCERTNYKLQGSISGENSIRFLIC